MFSFFYCCLNKGHRFQCCLNLFKVFFFRQQFLSNLFSIFFCWSLFKTHTERKKSCYIFFREVITYKEYSCYSSFWTNIFRFSITTRRKKKLLETFPEKREILVVTSNRYIKIFFHQFLSKMTNIIIIIIIVVIMYNVALLYFFTKKNCWMKRPDDDYGDYYDYDYYYYGAHPYIILENIMILNTFWERSVVYKHIKHTHIMSTNAANTIDIEEYSL